MELEYESMTVDEINSEILECARYGEDEELLKYITHGGDVNACDHNGNSALHKAGFNDQLSKSQKLSCYMLTVSNIQSMI